MTNQKLSKRWKLKAAPDKKITDHLFEVLNVSPILCDLLNQRGIKTYDEAKYFFRPDLKDLHDPFLMKDMDLAVERILLAIQNNERILIYGDYDVDGTTAVSLVFSFLEKRHKNIGYYIPDRYKEGYGISEIGISFAAEQGYTLIIALDCGIKAHARAIQAKQLGLDLIVCDHHLPGDTLPEAYALLDPKRSDCNYPFKELCGCGIGFKLAQAIIQKTQGDIQELYEYLDLAVISIAADIVPIIDENRILAFHGLIELNKRKRPGISAILDIAGLTKTLEINDVVFGISPRINAAGRIKSGNEAVQLILSKESDLAVQYAKQIDEHNKERRLLDASITEHALELLAEKNQISEKLTTVLYHADWHKGVVGIVASRLIETYYKPTIVMTETEGKLTGSARSVKDFDVYQAIDACSDLLDQYGGHMYAAGLTMDKKNFEAFSQKFEEIVSASLPEENRIPQIDIDLLIDLTTINLGFLKLLMQFAPFGPGNMSPVFRTNRMRSKYAPRIVGKNHLKLSLISETGVAFDAIAFGQSDKLKETEPGSYFDICYNLEQNIWNGNTTIQLNIKDIAACS